MTEFISKDKARKKGSDFQSIVSFTKLAQGHHLNLSLALGFMITAFCVVIFSAYLIGEMVDKGIGQNNYAVAVKFGLLTLACELVHIFFYYFGRKLLASTSLKVLFNVRNKLFNKLKTLPMSYFDTQPLGRTVTRLTHDVENLENFFSGSMPRLLGAFLSLIIVSVAMLSTHFKLGSMLFIGIIPSVAITFIFRNRVRKLNAELSKNNSSINARLSELLNGIPVIRAFGLEKWSKKYFDLETHKFLISALALNRLNSWTRPSVSLLAMFPILILIFVGTPMVSSGALSLGLLITFLRYSERFYRPVYTISQEIHQLQNAFSYLDRVLTLLSEEDESKLIPEGKENISDSSIEIEFKDLWMKYSEDTPWVLKGLNLKINKGENLGIIGRTGSGKTSTVSLISRLYEYQKGDIILNGQSIRKYKRNSIRSSIGFISQNVVIFEGSLRDNLCLGKVYDDKQILMACENSGLITTMRRKQMGLEFEILNKGANLSTGERQLLAITRIFLDKPKLIILDEATANIDEQVEGKIQAALQNVMKNTTSLIIAHRLNTLDMCDRIAKIEDGKLVSVQ